MFEMHRKLLLSLFLSGFIHSKKQIFISSVDTEEWPLGSISTADPQGLRRFVHKAVEAPAFLKCWCCWKGRVWPEKVWNAISIVHLVCFPCHQTLTSRQGRRRKSPLHPKQRGGKQPIQSCLDFYFSTLVIIRSTKIKAAAHQSGQVVEKLGCLLVAAGVEGKETRVALDERSRGFAAEELRMAQHIVQEANVGFHPPDVEFVQSPLHFLDRCEKGVALDYHLHASAWWCFTRAWKGLNESLTRKQLYAEREGRAQCCTAPLKSSTYCHLSTTFTCKASGPSDSVGRKLLSRKRAPRGQQSSKKMSNFCSVGKQTLTRRLS